MNTLCVYECDPDTMEAEHVRWFCCQDCRELWPKADHFVYGTDDEWIDGTVCDECGTMLLATSH